MDLDKAITEKLNGIEVSDPAHVRQVWLELDRIIQNSPEDKQFAAWTNVLAVIGDGRTSKGHPYFRLGVLHLLRDTDEKKALEWLEKAYEEDQTYAPESGRLAHRMGAYRLLALVKGYFEHISAKRSAGKSDWECEQFQGTDRRDQIETLLLLYDRSLVHPLDIEGHTYQSFFRLISDRDLCRFAIENYFCAEELIRILLLEAPASLRNQHEYPLSRAIVGLLGGVIEAVLADRMPSVRPPTLGTLMREAYSNGVLQRGSRLAALCSLMLYLRNHIHADRDAQRKLYFIDISVARGCKAALDWMISELLRASGTTPWLSGSTQPKSP